MELGRPELVLDPMLMMLICDYYFVDHDTQCLFWLEPSVTLLARAIKLAGMESLECRRGHEMSFAVRQFDVRKSSDGAERGVEGVRRSQMCCWRPLRVERQLRVLP
jgi:hypothetical protein